MARQIGSGRTGVQETLRNRRFPGKVLERRATIDDDPEVHLARAIETDHPRDSRDPGTPREHDGRMRRVLTRVVRSGCADDPVYAPLLLSLLNKFGYTDAEMLHDNITYGFMLFGKLKEGVGWPSKPDVAAPLPYHEFVPLLAVTFATNSQKNPWDGQRWRRDLEPKIQVHGDPDLRDRSRTRHGQIESLSQHQRNAAPRRLTTGPGPADARSSCFPHLATRSAT
jgi:hypothetical protein